MFTQPSMANMTRIQYTYDDKVLENPPLSPTFSLSSGALPNLSFTGQSSTIIVFNDLAGPVADIELKCLIIIHRFDFKND